MKSFYEIILEWVGKTYGSQQMEDPSWDVKSLANYIADQDIHPDELNAMTKLEAYNKVKQAYLEEDMEDKKGE